MTKIKLHVPRGPLSVEGDKTSPLTLDPSSLAAVFYLQLTRSGQYELHSTEDVSSTPHGYVPYCLQGNQTVSTFESIITHLGNQLDDGLTEEEFAKAVAWKACIQTKLSDLSLYLYYGNALNYNTFTHPNLVSGLPFLKRYYLPKRVRESFKRRLESEGMWEEGVHDRERDKTSKGLREAKETRDETVVTGRRKIKHAFAQEKVLEQARVTFALFDRLLNRSEGRFVFGNSPTSTDLLLAAHVLILAPTSSSLPDKRLGELMEKEFPSLLSHARVVQELCLQNRTPRTTPCTCVE